MYTLASVLAISGETRTVYIVQSAGFSISWLLYQLVSLSVGSLVVFAVIDNGLVWSIVQKTSQLNALD